MNILTLKMQRKLHLSMQCVLHVYCLSVKEQFVNKNRYEKLYYELNA